MDNKLFVSLGALVSSGQFFSSCSVPATSFQVTITTNHQRKVNVFDLFPTKKKSQLINFKCQVISTSLA